MRYPPSSWVLLLARWHYPGLPEGGNSISLCVEDHPRGRCRMTGNKRYPKVALEKRRRVEASLMGPGCLRPVLANIHAGIDT